MPTGADPLDPKTPVFEHPLPGAPQTHVFVIGVGAYRHLLGGEGPLAERHLGLGQLTSPQVSARSLAEWVIGSYMNPNAPLGSVYLLISEPKPSQVTLPDGSSKPVTSATIDHIEEAFDAWLKRVKENPDNAAILYYCGHGVLIQGDLLLLAEDYGENAHRPFDGAFNFEILHKGMASQHKGMQCYFIDACSNVPVGDLDIQNAGARAFPIVTAPLSKDQAMLVLRAAAPGSLAYARDAEVSRFTGALMNCLKGRGCDQSEIPAKWVVTSNSLVYSMNQVIEWENKNLQGPLQLIDPTKNQKIVQIHQLKEAPVIPVKIAFDPGEAIDDADLQLVSQEDAGWIRQRTAQPGVWEPDEVRAGFYTLTARFKQLQYRELSRPLPVFPPGPWEKPFVPEKV